MSRRASYPSSSALPAVEKMLSVLRRTERFSLAQLWFPAEEDNSFVCAVSVPGDRKQDHHFLQYCRGIRMSPDDAVINRALKDAAAIWFEDISRVIESGRNDRIREAGYLGYCCVPLFAEDAPLAVAEFFDTAPRAHDPEALLRIELHLLESLSDIERYSKHFRMLIRDEIPPSLKQRHRFQEGELSMLFTIAPLGIVITDEDDYIVEVNDRFKELFGFVDQEITGESFSALLHPDNPLAESASYQDIKAGKRRIVQIEKRYHVNDHAIDVRIHLSGMAIRSGEQLTWYCVRMIENVSEARKLHEQLLQAETRRSGELRQFAIRVQNAQEEERRRIASDLHDDLCQRMSGMKLNIEVFEDEIRALDENAFQKLLLLKSQIEGMIDTVRRMSSSLRPSVLDDFGLVAALRVMAREHNEVHGLNISILEEEYQSTTALREYETALYRIAQEALSNIVHHAQAGEASIELTCRNQEIVMIIRDNGIGFIPSEIVFIEGSMHGMGLVSMRERAEHLRGTLLIESTPGTGTSITVRLPYPVPPRNLP
jgi:PAS domain S-box-containing protein